MGPDAVGNFRVISNGLITPLIMLRSCGLLSALFHRHHGRAKRSMGDRHDSTPSAVDIRTAKDGDLESLVEAHGSEISASQIKRRLEESREEFRTMLVAVQEGRAVGSVSIGGGRFQREDSLRLFALDVGPAFRRNGVGSALVYAVETIAAESGLDKVNMEVEIDNEDAIRLYSRLGYRICGDPVMDRWTRLKDDGTSETIEVPVL